MVHEIMMPCSYSKIAILEYPPTSNAICDTSVLEQRLKNASGHKPEFRSSGTRRGWL